MSLNIKDRYDLIINEHIHNNSLFSKKDQYAGLISFKKALDDYAKEKLEDFIDDHFPEETLQKSSKVSPSVSLSVSEYFEKQGYAGNNVNKKDETLTLRGFSYNLYELCFRRTNSLFPHFVSTVAQNEQEAIRNFLGNNNIEEYEIISVELVKAKQK